MDGNKKIKGIVIAGIIAFAITACKVQSPGYISLYVDNSISVTDTTDPGVTPLNIMDVAITRVADKTSVIELPVFLPPAEEIFKVSSDSVYQHEVEKLLKAITDSIQQLRYQMIELQEELTILPDTSFTGEKPQEFQLPDSLQTEVDLKQLIQAKNETIAMLNNQANELKKSAGLKADTVYITKEIVKILKGDSLQADYETTRMLQTRNDTIVALRKQLSELQNSGITKSDTVYVMRETVKSPISESQQTDYLIQQVLRAKDEQIQMLQNQLNAMQNAAARTPQPTYITREPAQVQPLSSQQTDHLPLQQLQTQNDTIQSLRSQLYNLRLLTQIRDTIIKENEAREMEPANELVSDQETYDLFQTLQDTIQLLKTRLLSLEEQTLPGKDTTALTRLDERDAPDKAITDTTLLIAFYELGGIKPFEEDLILRQIEELCTNKQVTKITLSGYTDSSGSEIINKEITNKRLYHLSEMIIPWIEKEKIFYQNFGDTFASDMVVSNERRIEIRIHTK